MDKCTHCPLRDSPISCYGGEARLCFYLDPSHPAYNPDYARVFVAQSKAQAGEAVKAPGLPVAPSARPQPSPGPVEPEEAASEPPGPSGAMPPIREQMKTFAKAALGHALDGFRSVDDGEFARRIAICEGCEKFTKDRKCSVCGCFCDIKARWASERCPLEPPKWGEGAGDSKVVRPFAPVLPKPDSGCGCGSH